MLEVSTFQKERQSLKAVLSSEIFSRSPHLTKLLTYLCEKYFEGRSAELKEYSIAIDALGRPADSDDTGSAAARVQMHRLRAKLNEYYEREGRLDPMRIILKPGVYTPQFLEVDPPTEGIAPPEAPVPPSSQVRRAWRRAVDLRWPLGVLGLAVVLTITLMARMWLRRDALPDPAQPALSPLSSGSVSLASPTPSASSSHNGALRTASQGPVRILPGSDKPSVVDALGNIWLGDRYFSGGEAQVTPPALLGLTSDPVLFETYRKGRFIYKIPLTPGSYELHLYFADFLGPRRDLQPKVLRDFVLDINDGVAWRHQSHPLTYGTRPPLETEKIFKDVSPAKDGYLKIRFIPLLNDAFLNGLMIVPTPDHRASPIRIVAQEKTVTDRRGQVWLPDRFFTSGNLVVHGAPVTGTADPELFAGERYGMFQYIVPVADSSYTVNLYFVESWLGPGAPGGGGRGSRVFQVGFNDQRLLRHFDIFAESGGTGRSLVKSFHGIKPDADGNIMLSFIPIEGVAGVNAIEITDEGGASAHSLAQP
ncbi:MAG: malectin domain-containing carbohydrate-binding protein [Terriglobia bacterium]